MPKDKKTRDAGQETPRPDDVKQAAESAEESAELTELKNRVTEAEQRAEDYLEAARRLQAEFDNFRKRNAQVRTDAFDDGARELAAALLPVYDNFERAVQSADEGGDESPLAEGVRMLRRSFMETLQKQGIEEIEAAPGIAFDHNLHNAVMTAEPTEDYPDGTIAEVLQKGYTMREKTIRIAMVRVSHGG